MKIQGDRILDDSSSGMIDDLSVADSILPSNAVRKAMNVILDRPRGSISQRFGTTRLGSTDVESGQTILGLHNFRSSTDSADHQILVAVNGKVYHLITNETVHSAA